MNPLELSPSGGERFAVKPMDYENNEYLLPPTSEWDTNAFCYPPIDNAIQSNECTAENE